MTDTFQPEKYKDEYYEKVMEVVQNKIQGVMPQAPAVAAKAPGKVVDLMEILKQSLKETQKPAKPSHEETVTAGSARESKPKSRKAR
jgi:DNA end-binding protein Ku